MKVTEEMKTNWLTEHNLLNRFYRACKSSEVLESGDVAIKELGRELLNVSFFWLVTEESEGFWDFWSKEYKKWYDTQLMS